MLSTAPKKKIIPLRLKSNSNTTRPPGVAPTSNLLLEENGAQGPHILAALNLDMEVENSPSRIIQVLIDLFSLKVAHYIGEKITDEPMDLCMLCCLPILIYGRLIPCQHFMCIQCVNSISLQACLKFVLSTSTASISRF